MLISLVYKLGFRLGFATFISRVWTPVGVLVPVGIAGLIIIAVFVVSLNHRHSNESSEADPLADQPYRSRKRGLEIWCGNREVAKISKKPRRDYEIELYAAANGGAWHFDLNEFKAMREKGIKELANNP